jgi:hypothetical protein
MEEKKEEGEKQKQVGLKRKTKGAEEGREEEVV